MTNYHELVPLPAKTDINSGLTYCKPSTLLDIFGKPGRLTPDCSPVTSAKLRAELATHQFNHFSVTGWGPAVTSLVEVMAAIYAEKPDLHAVIRTAGMLCCRAIRGSTSNFSNHSWGCAIDLEIESELDALGARQVQAGILAAYPYFHKAGWFWGAGFSRPDVMHFELADSTVKRLAGK